MRLVDRERREIGSVGEKGEWGWAVDCLNSSWMGICVQLVITRCSSVENNKLITILKRFTTKLLLVYIITCMHTLSGEPQDRHVVIVDDLVQTGGTLIQCAKVRWSLLPSVVITEYVVYNTCCQCADVQHLQWFDKEGLVSGSPCLVFQLCSLH